MKISYIKQKPKDVSFGWLAKTHSAITKRAIDKIPELLPYRRLIQTGSVVPDISPYKTSLLGSKAHIYDGSGYFSYDIVPQNASDFYCECITNALSELNFGNKKVAMYRFGEALHFLQDMAVPMHTKKECQSPLKIFKHIKYESLAGKHHELIDDMIKKQKTISDTNFQNLFLDTYKKSSSMQNPFEKNQKDRWLESIEYAYSNAFDASCKFLKKISILANATQHERTKLIDKEFYETLKLLI